MERAGEQREDRAGNRTTVQAKWTFLVYMAEDNNLDGAALRDIAEMAKTGSTKDVHILVQLDRIEDQLTRRFRIIANQASSGMNIAAYCREGHIHTSLFHTWRRRLSEQQSAGGFIKLSSDRSIGRVSGICIRMGGSVRVEVERGFDPATLRAVIEALSRCSA